MILRGFSIDCFLPLIHRIVTRKTKKQAITGIKNFKNAPKYDNII